MSQAIATQTKLMWYQYLKLEFGVVVAGRGNDREDIPETERIVST